MAQKTKIEWTDATWNPTVGCSIVSQGCHHCYAATMAKRLRAMGRPEYQDVVTDDGRWTGTVTEVHSRLDQPLRWTRPRRVFVNSMSDLFHEEVSFEFIDRVFAVMGLAQQHTFQILTKRAARMAEYLHRVEERGGEAIHDSVPGDDAFAKRDYRNHLRLRPWPFPNVWLGISAEDQPRADARIALLRRCPAAVRFVSFEPLLGPIDFGHSLAIAPTTVAGELASDLLHWVIVGGESGPQARPMHPAWPRAIRDQCQAAGVPFFFKQHGEWACAHQWGGFAFYCSSAAQRMLAGDRLLCPDGYVPRDGTPNGKTYPLALMRRIGKKAAGRRLDGRTWDEFPEEVSGEALAAGAAQ